MVFRNNSTLKVSGKIPNILYISGSERNHRRFPEFTEGSTRYCRRILSRPTRKGEDNQSTSHLTGYLTHLKCEGMLALHTCKAGTPNIWIFALVVAPFSLFLLHSRLISVSSHFLQILKNPTHLRMLHIVEPGF